MCGYSSGLSTLDRKQKLISLFTATAPAGQLQGTFSWKRYGDDQHAVVVTWKIGAPLLVALATTRSISLLLPLAGLDPDGGIARGNGFFIDARPAINYRSGAPHTNIATVCAGGAFGGTGNRFLGN